MENDSPGIKRYDISAPVVFKQSQSEFKLVEEMQKHILE